MQKPTPEPLESGVLLVPPRFGSFTYRHLNSKGDVLYVGLAKDVIARSADHARGSAWWQGVRRIEWDMYDNRDEAAWAERIAINTLNPRHNIAGFWQTRSA